MYTLDHEVYVHKIHTIKVALIFHQAIYSNVNEGIRNATISNLRENISVLVLTYYEMIHLMLHDNYKM